MNSSHSTKPMDLVDPTDLVSQQLNRSNSESLESSRTLERSNSRTSSSKLLNPRTLEPPNCRTPLSLKWYVLWTHSQSEQLVHNHLANRGFDVFLPTIEMWARRHGMRYRRCVPMFPGYLFLQHRMDPRSYVDVCQTRGLVKLLGQGWDQLATVPVQEIEAIRTLHASGLPATPHPYMRTGDRVRIIEGLLANATGILLRINPTKGLLVISVNLLQRSVAVEIDCSSVVPA